MQSYIREHTVGGVIRGTFRIYFQNFMTIIVAYLIPVLPFQLLQVVAMSEESGGLLVVSGLGGLIAGLLAVAAITLIISDFCVGNKISIVRVYKRVFGTLIFKLLATNLLQMLAIMVGIVLLVIPGFIAIAWFLFSSTIVVLEGTWGAEALKRSKQLGGTKHWRNMGVFLILIAVGAVFGAIVGGISGAMVQNQSDVLGFQFVMVIMQQLLFPLTLIAIVLLYYDLRVRKEAYNLEALAEDLKF